MGIVRGEHKAVCQMDQIILPCVTETAVYPRERIVKEGGCGALFGRAAHFLTVQYAVYGKMGGFLSSKKALQRGKGTLEIIQAPAGDELLRSSPNACLLSVIEKEVMAQDFIFLNSGGFGDHLHKGPFCREAAVEREHIFLGIVFIAVVSLPVHMDGKIRDQQEIPVYIDQPGAETALAVFDDDPASHGERAVQPGSAEHSPVALHVQPDIMSVGFQLRVFLDLKSRRITVAGDDAHTVESSLRNRERDQRSVTARDKITAAGAERPFLILV